MNAHPESPPKIDWAYYKKNISVSGLVDKFQKEYESFKVPYPVDNYTSQIETQEKEVVIVRKYSIYLFNLYINMYT
jgi:F-type H+-transporting ATPase subunit d